MPSFKNYGKGLVVLTPFSNLFAADFDFNRTKFKCILTSIFTVSGVFYSSISKKIANLDISF